MVCFSCVRREKFRFNFVPWTFASIALTLRYGTKHEFRVPWCVSCAFVAKSSDATSWHELLHQLHQYGPFCTKFSAVAKRSQVHPNITKHTKTWVWGPMVWIGRIRSDKFRWDFVARTFALIAPDWPICTEFSTVAKRSQMLPNITKWNKNWV